MARKDRSSPVRLHGAGLDKVVMSRPRALRNLPSQHGVRLSRAS